VDDEPLVLDFLARWLRQVGFVVQVAADGPEALEVYQQHHDAIAAVLLDVTMPIWSGPRTLEALRGVNPRVRCCFMTGYAATALCEGLQALGVTEVLQKPFEMPAVLRTLRRLADPGEGMPDRA
jgi:CheY-like chemotaxis protein